ncbi:MAG: hypothetical protein GWP61_12065 [Chloroflexi bacterium]|jgi:hypothetical protein|nr:hypothetical protein [Chloroflexota bacterium]
MDEILTQCKPVVSKSWLHFTAGLMWSAVGIMLLSLASGWLKPLGIVAALPFALVGGLLALAFLRFSFSGLACKNVGRIEQIDGDRTCLFAFQAWKSYPLIAFMIALGITLRHYTPIPKPYLAIVYIGVGGGLFLSSLRYYRHIWNGRITDKDR